MAERDFEKEKAELAANTPMSHPLWRQKWIQFTLERVETGVKVQECPTCGFADPQFIRDFIEWLLADQRKEIAQATSNAQPP